MSMPARNSLGEARSLHGRRSCLSPANSNFSHLVSTETILPSEPRTDSLWGLDIKRERKRALLLFSSVDRKTWDRPRQNPPSSKTFFEINLKYNSHWSSLIVQNCRIKIRDREALLKASECFPWDRRTKRNKNTGDERPALPNWQQSRLWFCNGCTYW